MVSTVGKKGVIVEQSKNCIFIVCSDTPIAENKQDEKVGEKRKFDEMSEDDELDQGRSKPQDSVIGSQKIYRVIKESSVLGIILPVTVSKTGSDGSSSSTSEVSQNICVLYGSKFLPAGRPTTKK
jgi:hypothetical protein